MREAIEMTEFGDPEPQFIDAKTGEKIRQSVVEIELKPNSTGKIIVDGVDLSKCAYHVELVGSVGKPTDVVVCMRAVEVKVMTSAVVTHKLLTLDPDTAKATE